METKSDQIRYLEIFKDAWKLAWRNKYLWWFGLFIAVANLGGMNFYANDSGSDDEVEQKVVEFISQNTEWLLIVAISIVIIWLLFVVLGILGRGALISSISRHIKNEASDFRLGFRKGKKYFWRIFFISVILGIFMLASAITLFTPAIFLFLNKNYVIGVFMLVFAGLIFLPLMILAFFVWVFAQMYAVLGELRIWDAFENAYNLFQKNIWTSLIFGLLFIPIGILFMIAVVSALLIVGLVFLGFGLLLFLVARQTGVVISVVLAFLVFLPIFLAIRSFYEVFSQAAWVLFFEKIARSKKEELAEEKVPEPMPDTKPATATEVKMN
jgi:hypothetical protein